MRLAKLALTLVFLAACEPETAPPVVPIAPPQPSAPPVASASAAPLPGIDPLGIPYPPAKREDVKDLIHGVTVLDPYRWLENAKDPAVQDWMHKEDALARAELAKLPGRDEIAARLKKLFYVDKLGAPSHRGNRYFWSRHLADKEKSIVYWKQGKKGKEKVLFDPNGWSQDGSVSLGTYRVSWDGKKVAYAVHKNNSDDAVLHVMDVASGKDSPIDTIEGARYAAASWTPKGDGFYYTWLPTDPKIPDAERPGYAEIRFHTLGKDPKTDAIVHEKLGDPTSFQNAYLSIDGHWLIYEVDHGWTSTDLSFMDMRKKERKLEPLVVGDKAHYSAEAFKDSFYVTTDEGAPKSRIFRVDPKKPARADWVEIVPERADATIDGASVIGGKIAIAYLKNASSRLEVKGLDGKPAGEVALPGIGTMDGPYGRPDEDEAYYSYESFTTPSETYALSMKTLKPELYTKVAVDVDPTPYTVEQVFYPSKDGTQVSMFIVHRKDLKKDGSSRLLMWGYGGFQVSETSRFAASIYPWLERGGVYAVPNLRGGCEYGEDWHKHGMLLEKQHVFDDFIAAAEYLVKEGYTKPERLAIYGGSNGGLLIGAVTTQRPDLFAVSLCAVPLLDMVRYTKFGAGATWISEYGSPEDPEQFKALFAYSPYHHVTMGTKYPAVLLLSADSDDRVDPMHARKFAAALQAASTGGPVLLRIEKNSGHGGADLVKAEVEKGADRYAFALQYTGG